MAAFTSIALGVMAAASVASGFASYQQGKKQAKKQKQEIARQRGVAQDKRSSLIRQQRNQLGGKGDYSIKSSKSTPAGYTAQGEETLG